MHSPLSLFVIAGLLMLCSALTLFVLGRRVDKMIPVSRRLDAKLQQHHKAHIRARGFSPTRWALRLSQRAGFELNPPHLMGFLMFFVLACTTGFLIDGVFGLSATLGIFTIGTYIVALWRSAANYQKLIQQLPSFIDQIIRIMGIGRSFDSALLEAIDDSPPELAKALQNVLKEHKLGGDIAESLEEAAELYHMHELLMVTLTLKINQRYGGSVKDMLESIIKLIRQREEAARELKSMTGETRFSAWMLGIMPIATVCYMLIVNPNYLEYLFKDPNGYTIFYTAAGLQVAGGLILWRMLRSIE
ncbi:MAG: type II secretion system F family protein [Gammaproteobacteria bacterium]